MSYETRQKKKSQFTSDDTLTGASTFDFVKNGINKKTSWSNLLALFEQRFGLSMGVYETESAMVADTDLALGNYAIVEENYYAVYKITNIAAVPGDVTLSNGLIASQEGRCSNNEWASYADIRALKSSAFRDGEIITPTNDGIAGQFVVKTGTVTDNGGTLIVFTDDSNRYAERIYDDAVNPLWFGVVLDGATDNTTANQFVLDNFDVIEFPSGGSNLTGALTIPKTVKSLVSNCTFIPNANSIILFQVLTDTTRVATTHIKGLRVDGTGTTGVTGLKLGSLTNNPSPGAFEAVLYLSIEDLYISRCDTGFDAYMVMELIVTNYIAHINTVGLKLYSDPINGGANANIFNACRLQGNQVGLMIANQTASLPLHNNIFNNPVFQGNTLCGLYINSTTGGPTAGIVFNNGHYEVNGIGAPGSAVIDGFTVTKSSVNIDGNAEIIIRDSSISDSVTPNYLLRNGVKLYLDNVSGYGSSVGDVIDVDSTSKVFEDGIVEPIANRIVESYGNIASPDVEAFIEGAPIINIGMYRNDCTFSDCIAPSITNTSGVVAVGISKDLDFGLTSYVHFAASAGSTSTNRNFWIAQTGSANDYVFQSFLCRSDLDTDITFNYQASGAIRSKTVSFRAGEWRRIILIARLAVTAALQTYIYPSDSVGATIFFRGMQQIRTDNDKIVDHFYKTGNVGVSDIRVEKLTAAPTEGTWSVGDTIYNSSPSVDGNNMILDRWVCTVAGTPGTWVPQYVSTVTPAT